MVATSLVVQWLTVQSLSHVQLFATPWTAARQASLSITNSWSLLKLMSIESVMPSNHLIFCRPLLLPPSIFPHEPHEQYEKANTLCSQFRGRWRVERGGVSSILGQGTWSHMPQLKAYMPQLKILHAATKTGDSASHN